MQYQELASVFFLCCLPGCFLKFLLHNAVSYSRNRDGAASVSYTHLDVYKRQLLCFFQIVFPVFFQVAFRVSFHPQTAQACLLYTSRCV